MTDMSAIVGAGFPRPTGWRTQPLRIPPSRLPFTCRPSGALGYFVIASFYKHAAPLGLKTDALTCRPPGALGYFVIASFYKHAAPLGLKTDALTCRPSGALGYFVIAPFYKHVAPLGLKAGSNRL